MSADNWAECPYCKDENDKAWQVRKDALDLSYGKIPVEEYLTERERVGDGPDDMDRTFREDYEFWVDGDTVNVSYSGTCTSCGASAKHCTEFPINPPTKTKTNNKEANNG